LDINLFGRWNRVPYMQIGLVSMAIAFIDPTSGYRSTL
jgi:hypothetical protein